MRLAESLLAPRQHDPEAPLYRSRTVAMLHKYLRMSLELGHMPALMGMEFFRSHVSTYTTHSFEDTAIFVHDVEQVLHALPQRYQDVIVNLFFLEYTNDEAARLLNIGHSSMVRWRFEAIDAITSIFLERKLLKRMPQLPVEPFDFAEEPEPPQAVADSSLPPKKEPHGVKTIHAVSISA